MPWTLSEIPEEEKIKVMLEKDRLVARFGRAHV